MGLVDAVIDAFQRADSELVGANIVAQTVQCVAQPLGIGGPPTCADDEPVGTDVEVFPEGTCEGYFTRIEDVNSAAIVSGAPRIFAVFEVDFAPGDPNRPLGDYGMVFAVASGGARTVFVDSRGILNVLHGCGEDAFGHSARGTTFLLGQPS